MIAKVVSAAVIGINAHKIGIETFISAGLPSFSIVGLPDTAVRESRDRVVSAIKNSGFDFPNKKITVNLTPADLKKEGASFDLPIAVGILRAKGYIRDFEYARYCFIGELSLDGKIRKTKGILPIVLGLKEKGVQRIIVPEENAAEASVVRGLEVFSFKKLKDVVSFLNGELIKEPNKILEYDINQSFPDCEMDFSEVKGQNYAKRALEIAAAGAHNVIMVGPPGSGKTMLAKRMPTILPHLNFEEAVESTKVHSVAGLLPGHDGLLRTRPFRSPHHTVSNIALIGGGTNPKPGEVSLAHNGILFLDELTEFHRDVLEVLRQPLEEREVTVSRAKSTVTYPSSFMLLGAMNPCPCGNFGHGERECLCTPYQVNKYRSKISGPLLDRVDIHIEVPALKTNELIDSNYQAEPSKNIRKRVLKAREIQLKRFIDLRIYSNSQMNSRLVKKHCILDNNSKSLLNSAIDKFNFSARAYDRILKISRTIADLSESADIQPSHIAEAIGYRSLDRPV